MEGNIVFKEWLPDLADLNNPGVTDVQNVLPLNGRYKSFSPLAAATINSAMAGVPISAMYSKLSTKYYGYQQSTSGSGYFVSIDAAWTAKSAAIASSGFDGVDFVEYDNLIIAAVDNAVQLMCITAGSTGQFTALATSGDAPQASHVGVINRIVMASHFANGASGTTSSYVRWSSIDNPRDWPTPNSSTAIARQAGEQWLDPKFGIASSVVSGDQFGIVFQRHGINRVTYVGGSTVFQFDNYEAERGAFFMNATVSVAGLTYFVSDKGFFVTDGSTVRDIGANKINRFFINDVNFGNGVYDMRVALDVAKNLIYWSYPSTSSLAGLNDRLLIYNWVEDRWTRANQQAYALFTGGNPSPGITSSGYGIPMGFGASYTLSAFTGTPGTAYITSAEVEPEIGRYTRISGVAPQVDATVNAVTVAIGTRDGQASAVSYSSETTANARSGFADFRSEARYVRARVTISGTFNSATGANYIALPSGKV